MCLSTVYIQKSQNEAELLCTKIASVSANDKELVFTNLLGVPTKIKGEISKIDLIENCIYVREKSE